MTMLTLMRKRKYFRALKFNAARLLFPLGIAADTGLVAKASCSMSEKPGPLGNGMIKI